MEEDTIREFLEECQFNDIDAPPMSERLGIRVAPSQPNPDRAVEQVQLALELNIKNFDVCYDGGKETICAGTMKGLLEEKGLTFMEVKVTAV